MKNLLILYSNTKVKIPTFDGTICQGFVRSGADQKTLASEDNERMDLYFYAIFDIRADWRKGKELTQDTSLLAKLNRNEPAVPLQVSAHFYQGGGISDELAHQ
mgnify:CR=1 FL=1